jgi:hypothetical protein
MWSTSKTHQASCPSCLLVILAFACSPAGDGADPVDPPGSGTRSSSAGAASTAGSEPQPAPGGSGTGQSDPGAGGSIAEGGTSNGSPGGGGLTSAGGASNGNQGGTGGSAPVDPSTGGEERWHCIGTMQQSACSCVLASTEPVAPYESGCPSGVSYVCCYTSDTFNADDACSCWTQPALTQLGQTCAQLLQLAESAGAMRVDSCSND